MISGKGCCIFFKNVTFGQKEITKFPVLFPNAIWQIWFEWRYGVNADRLKSIMCMLRGNVIRFGWTHNKVIICFSRPKKQKKKFVRNSYPPHFLKNKKIVLHFFCFISTQFKTQNFSTKIFLNQNRGLNWEILDLSSLERIRNYVSRFDNVTIHG